MPSRYSLGREGCQAAGLTPTRTSPLRSYRIHLLLHLIQCRTQLRPRIACPGFVRHLDDPLRSAAHRSSMPERSRTSRCMRRGLSVPGSTYDPDRSTLPPGPARRCDVAVIDSPRQLTEGQQHLALSPAARRLAGRVRNSYIRYMTRLATMSDAEVTRRIRQLRTEQLRRAGKAHTCAVCGTEFFARADARLCSGRCRARLFRARSGADVVGGERP